MELTELEQCLKIAIENKEKEPHPQGVWTKEFCREMLTEEQVVEESVIFFFFH